VLGAHVVEGPGLLKDPETKIIQEERKSLRDRSSNRSIKMSPKSTLSQGKP
jgi:hypothetical protein